MQPGEPQEQKTVAHAGELGVTQLELAADLGAIPPGFHHEDGLGPSGERLLDLGQDRTAAFRHRIQLLSQGGHGLALVGREPEGARSRGHDNGIRA